MTKHLKTKEKKKWTKLLRIIQIIFIIILIFSIIEVFKWYKDNNSNKEILESISNEVTINTEIESDNAEKYEINFQSLKEKNQDTVAWIKVNNTNIEYPVVKSTDNEYYLNHSFNKSKNSTGWIFADYKNKFDNTDKNIVIYGHNRKDESMFGTLSNILKAEWYNNEENMSIIYITESEKCIYRVFSVYKIENEDYYIQTEFSDSKYNEFLKTITKRSINNFNVDVTGDDKILTLSTCDNNNKYRVVLHAKKE